MKTLVAMLVVVAVPRVAGTSCTPATIDEGCHTWGAPPCDSSRYSQITGNCRCAWGMCLGTTYSCVGEQTCCEGWTDAGCLTPICAGGCGDGYCDAPGACACPEGVEGGRCETASSEVRTALKVLTLNFACRGAWPLEGCDNCKVRFDEMAQAFKGGAGYAGIPDLATVDVIVAQELSTAPENYAQVTAALEDLGFVYSSGAPGPIGGDPQCSDPPGLLFDATDKYRFAGISSLDSGGLVTFSKHEIVRTVKHNWCAHAFPTPAGYLMTLLDVGHNRRAAVFNLHMMPEYDIPGVDTADVRSYQFSEVTAFADKIGTAFEASGVAYTIIFGGDFNEDIYHGSYYSDSVVQCSKIGDAAKARFSQVGINLAAACSEGAIGLPTWNPTNNDLAKRFSGGSNLHEVLDLLVQHSTSAVGGTAKAAVNHVHVLRTVTPWSGQFCEDSTLGETGDVTSGTATALTDHNAVTASFALPAASSTSAAGAGAAVDNVVSAWSGQVAQAACGQEDISCAADSNCCRAEYSWSGKEQHCSDFQCEACEGEGASCSIQVEGSSCCGYEDYSSRNGLHCKTDLWSLSMTCVRKYNSGEKCVFDEDCNSRHCHQKNWWHVWWECE